MFTNARQNIEKNVCDLKNKAAMENAENTLHINAKSTVGIVWK